MSGDISKYISEITSEYYYAAKFNATVAALVQPFADIIEVELVFPTYYDLDVAVGVQLDTVGLWVGRTRFLAEPLLVYFSWDTAGLGWDQGVWRGPFDPISGLTILPDDVYRIVLRAVILANNWDGSIPGAYVAWDQLFIGTGNKVLIQDYEDSTMAVALWGPAPDALTLALFTTGELDLKPAGIELFHVTSTDPGAPFFSWDSPTTPYVGGWDIGAWGDFISSE